MFCRNCGQQLLDGSKFCHKCGTAVDYKNNNESARKTVYDGEIHKCPNCGQVMKSFETNCPSCGYELRSVKTNSPVEALAKKIEMASSLDEKNELIINFYIPNTKEDIFDIFILAVSNLEDKWYETDDAWRAKLEQAYHKARLSFGNTPEFEYLEKLYNRTCKEVSKRDRSISAVFRRNKVACVTALSIGGGILMIVVGIILLSTNSVEDNVGAYSGGLMFILIGSCFLLASPLVLDDMRKKEKHANKSSMQKNTNTRVQSVGKSAGAFISKHYEDVVEQLRVMGFKNIITKAEKKGLLDTEGAVKGISIAGNARFSEDDEFDIDSKIIIRYYSKNINR